MEIQIVIFSHRYPFFQLQFYFFCICWQRTADSSGGPALRLQYAEKRAALSHSGQKKMELRLTCSSIYQPHWNYIVQTVCTN